MCIRQILAWSGQELFYWQDVVVNLVGCHVPCDMRTSGLFRGSHIPSLQGGGGGGGGGVGVWPVMQYLGWPGQIAGEP